jgi:hypothetical protein
MRHADMKAEDGGDTPKRRTWVRRLYWPVWSVIIVGVLEMVARQFLAQPSELIRHSNDPDMVYELTPGTWVSHAKFGLWSMPIFMVTDLFNTLTNRTVPVDQPGYTAYRIDKDGCRLSMKGPELPTADVVALGSSQTFGLFVQEEETVVGMLEQQLRQHGLPGATVANCGVLGHHFVQTLRTGELERLRKRPRLNIVLVRPWHLREQLDYSDILNPKGELLRWLVHHSSLARVFYYLHRRETTQDRRPYLTKEALDEKVTAYARDMNESGVRSIFFLLEDHTPEDASLDVISDVLKRHGLEVERIWTPTGGGSEYFVDHERHWNAKGAALTAGEMLEPVVRALTTSVPAPQR